MASWKTLFVLTMLFALALGGSVRSPRVDSRQASSGSHQIIGDGGDPIPPTATIGDDTEPVGRIGDDAEPIPQVHRQHIGF